MSAKLHSQLYAEIKALELKLRSKYKYDLKLSYKLHENEEKPISLDDLYDGLIRVVGDNNPELQHYFLKNIKTRKKQVMDYKHAFRYIAVCSYDFGVTELARYLEIDHATVIHSRRLGDDLLDARDPGFIRAFTLLTEYFNTIFTDVGFTTEDSEE